MKSLQDLEQGSYILREVYPELNYLVLSINSEEYKANRKCVELLAGEDDACSALLEVTKNKGKFIKDGEVVIFKKLKLQYRGKVHDLN